MHFLQNFIIFQGQFNTMGKLLKYILLYLLISVLFVTFYQPRALSKLNVDQNDSIFIYQMCPFFHLCSEMSFKDLKIHFQRLTLIPFSWIHNETPQNSLLFKCLLIAFHVHMCFFLFLSLLFAPKLTSHFV